MQSYCDEGDKFCDNGGNLDVHLQEIQNHGVAAAKFIVSKFQASGNGTLKMADFTPLAHSSNITCSADVLPTGVPLL